ncbi:hypothetical protein EAO14_01730 [Klebsiella pneumoniae]|nr:hypothetical protein EAO14_01730 [Klebsiella pneumoniae]
MMTELLGGTPLFNNVNYGLQGLCGDGRLRGIDFIISESRRGIISTPVSVALTMMLVRRVSTGNALLACVQAYEKIILPIRIRPDVSMVSPHAWRLAYQRLSQVITK